MVANVSPRNDVYLAGFIVDRYLIMIAANSPYNNASLERDAMNEEVRGRVEVARAGVDRS